MIQWNMQAPNYSLYVFSGFNWIALVVLLRVSMAEILSLFPDKPWGLLQSGMIICIIWGLEKERESRTSVPAAGLWLWAIHVARHNALCKNLQWEKLCGEQHLRDVWNSSCNTNSNCSEKTCNKIKQTCSFGNLT